MTPNMMCAINQLYVCKGKIKCHIFYIRHIFYFGCFGFKKSIFF